MFLTTLVLILPWLLLVLLVVRILGLDDTLYRKLNQKPKTKTSYKNVNIVITGGSAGRDWILCEIIFVGSVFSSSSNCQNDYYLTG